MHFTDSDLIDYLAITFVLLLTFSIWPKKTPRLQEVVKDLPFLKPYLDLYPSWQPPKGMVNRIQVSQNVGVFHCSFLTLIDSSIRSFEK